jgi:hypothetical protein
MGDGAAQRGFWGAEMNDDRVIHWGEIARQEAEAL